MSFHIPLPTITVAERRYGLVHVAHGARACGKSAIQVHNAKVFKSINKLWNVVYVVDPASMVSMFKVEFNDTGVVVLSCRKTEDYIQGRRDVALFFDDPETYYKFKDSL